MSTISIVIATYKGADRLRMLFESMRSTGSDVEVVVVDDGSPSEEHHRIAEAVTAFGATFRRVEHGGCVAAMNAGIRSSTGDVILLLDDDVRVPSGLLDVVRSLFWSLENVGVFSWRSYGDHPGQSKTPRPGFLQPATQLASYCMAFRRTVWEEAGGLDERFRMYCADSDFSLRVTLAGHPSYRVWWPLVPHEEHACMDASPEIDRQLVTENDLASFLAKWGKSGSEMEQEALRGLANA